MNRYKVELPDKRVMTIEAPDPDTAQRDADAWFAENQGPQTSMLGSLARGLGQAAFGLGDEVEAGIRAAVDPNKTYDQTLPEVRQKVAQSYDEHPIATYGAEIAGSLALPLGLAAKGVGYTAKAVGQGLPALMKAGAKEGAVYGAAYGAGKSEGGVENRLEGAAGGAAAGAAIGGIAPAVVGGAGAIADSVRSNVNKIRNPLDEATRTITQAAKANDENADLIKALGMTPQRIDGDPYAQKLIDLGRTGQDVMLVDTMGASGRRLLRSATNNSPEAREIAEAALYPRSEGQSARAVDFIKSLTGREGNAGKTVDQLRSVGDRIVSPAYKAAMEAGDRPLWSRNLEALTGSDLVRSAMQKAAQTVNSRSIAEGGGAMNVGVNFENGVLRFTRGDNGRATYPNLRFWDETKKNIDAIVNKAKREGDNNLVDIGSRTAKRLREELDTMVDQYKAARGVAANFFDAEDAIEAGQKFASGKYDFHEVEKMLAKASDIDRGMFQEGFVAKYLDEINSTGDRRDLTKILMSDTNARRAFEVALGKTASRQLEAFLHIEKIMEASKGALGNSTTAQQLKDMGAAGVITGVGGGMLQGGYFDPTAAIMGAIGKYGVGKAKSNIDNKFAQHIVAVLTSKDPKHVNLATQQLATPDNLATLRRITAAITGGGAAAGASVAAQGERQ